jgi:hypothetical protein
VAAKIRKHLDHIKALQEESRRCVHTLEVWCSIAEKGIDMDDVKGFGFDPKFTMSTQELKLLSGPVKVNEEGHRVATFMVYNVAVLQDGTQVPIIPPIPVTPEDQAFVDKAQWITERKRPSRP